jgi:hypothetical protein
MAMCLGVFFLMRRFGNVKEFYLLRYNAVKSVER